MELPEILARIEKRLAALDLSETAAGKLAGKPDAIRNLRRALEKDERTGVSTATLNALAPVLKTTSVWLFAGAGHETTDGETASTTSTEALPSTTVESEVAQARQPIVAVVYAGLVEAGTFREVSDYTDLEPEEIYQPADPEFPHVRQLAFDVRGDSMNDLKPRPILKGDRVVALDFEGLRSRVALHTGMVVIVQQSLNGGLLVERSVKQLEVYEDRYEFHPRSTLTKYRPIVIPHDMQPDDGREVTILAWARSILNRL
jgi:phage repressor protein C with HTH and peptisase S24 domain